MKNNIWKEYFEDVNVKFPKKPQLIKGISIYDAPYGLGIQFRGGPEKVSLQGKHVKEYFDFIQQEMNKHKTLDEIFSDAAKTGLLISEISTLMKTLHAYHLLTNEEPEKETREDYAFNEQQLSYFDRMIKLTEVNISGKKTYDRLLRAKILFIITSDYMVPLIKNLNNIGCQNFCIYYILYDDAHKETVKKIQSLYDNNAVVIKDISAMKNEDLRNEIGGNIDFYTHVCSMTSHIALSFLQEITQICQLKDKVLLTLNETDNIYELGPLYSGKDTACYNCYTLRKQSNDMNSYVDYAYQAHPDFDQCDNRIKGADTISMDLMVNFMFLELIKIITAYAKPAVLKRVIKFDPLVGTMDFSLIEKVSGCPICM